MRPIPLLAGLAFLTSAPAFAQTDLPDAPATAPTAAPETADSPSASSAEPGGDEPSSDPAQAAAQASDEPGAVQDTRSAELPAPAAAAQDAGATPQPERRRPNELALEIGWNSPVGPGLRYLRELDDLPWSIGIGASPATFWGSRVSVLVRHQKRFAEGWFQQLSVGMNTGGTVTLPETSSSGRTTPVAFTLTPGRTIEGVVGYRFALGGWALDLFGGASIRLKGTALQDTSQTRANVSDAMRGTLWIMQPGGVSLGLSIGRRF